jgi:hypothetical protein
MIVNMQADGWEIIYYRAHAQIAAHWRPNKSPLRITDTIIIRHMTGRYFNNSY